MVRKHDRITHLLQYTLPERTLPLHAYKKKSSHYSTSHTSEQFLQAKYDNIIMTILIILNVFIVFDLFYILIPPHLYTLWIGLPLCPSVSMLMHRLSRVQSVWIPYK